MLNRSAFVIRPKQPFAGWLKSVEDVEDVGRSPIETNE